MAIRNRSRSIAHLTSRPANGYPHNYTRRTPRPDLQLPHHHFEQFGYSDRFSRDGENSARIFGLALMRGNRGGVICRRHKDLRPGEISLVLA